MKSWADHSSSDEDSDAEADLSVADLSMLNSKSNDDGISFDNSTIGVVSPSKSYDDEDFPPVPPPVDFGYVPPNAPNEAPYTAHIGNLSFGVKEGPDLAEEIEKLVTDRYKGEESVSVTEARVGVDRDTGKRRGYGYVEFGTLEELLVLLNLNDGFSGVSGRMIRIDIAQPRRERQPMRSNSRNRRHPNSMDNDGGRGPRSSSRNRGQSNFPTEIDGNQFRGGVRRANAPSSSGGSSGGVRPTLKLAPRSKPMAGGVSTGLSNIFGGAKPREENVRSRKQHNDGDSGAVASQGGSNTKGGEGKGVVDPRQNSDRTGRNGGRGDRKSGRGKGDVVGRGRGDASGSGRGDASSHVRGDASSQGRGDASGRGAQGGGGKKNKRGNARTRSTNEGDNAWNKSPIPSSKNTPPPIQPIEVLVPTDKKSVTSVKNSFAALLLDSDSE
eukprot:CAMPEP_0198263880 /NCGR_PEP_ID=MMETSP1447-20131203/13852_1 /TAXON_ID=420782 /ORGANISM="Chaetoceros dichaeta, Strain CCMP1751" /LENGTH=440 /DNA_ID=CAMNT_0043952637 /DNA_START=17 /DNA_END=1339 /DNA_ORIENTATION=+